MKSAANPSMNASTSRLLARAVTAYLANRRRGLAQTKTRGQVRGGGRKPWRQKGTGRARAGSIRSPLWRGGGVTFGPTGGEAYGMNLPKRERQAALRAAIALHETAGTLSLAELKSTKTKEAIRLIAHLQLKTPLLVVGKPEATRAFRNITGVVTRDPSLVHPYDLIRAQAVLVSAADLELLTARKSPQSSDNSL